MTDTYISVIVDLSIHKALDYLVPEELSPKIRPGMRVEVPVKGKTCSGYVLEIKEKSSYPSVKKVSHLFSEDQAIPEELFELALWIAKYYCAPIGKVLKSILPAPIRKNGRHKQQLFVMRKKTRGELAEIVREMRVKTPAQAAVLDIMLLVKKGILLTELLEESESSRSSVDALVKKGFLTIDIVRLDRSPLVGEEYFQTKPKILNPEQNEALKKVQLSIEKKQFDVHLLFGVTGSGKTEVYLQAIDKALAENRGVIMLVPEISLTAQTIERLRGRFEGHIAILHHRLSAGERFDEWHKIREGRAQIVVGARSAIFSPVKNLGLIIVDEEHESSYKQSEEAPCYNARDIAVMRGKLNEIPVVLGSATPSLESYYNCQNGKYILSVIQARADNASMPKVTIVDMKKEFEKAKGYTSFSELLLTEIDKRKSTGEQTILFLNRRGYHTTLLCQDCGDIVKCRHCDVTLTFHKGENHLACHLCSHTISPPPQQCSSCKSPKTLKFRGIGTEQIEKALHAIFPDIRTIRIDADTTKHKGSQQKLLRDFGSGKADVLIGTQMIAKGLHFPEVTLVGVLNSDATIQIPDFRASETAFQLITQVSGRSGRGAGRGEVILQTSMPDNFTIQMSAEQNYQKFYAEEIAIRELFKYPPFSRMAKITFLGKNEKQVQETANHFRNALTGHLDSSYELFPVTPAGHVKVKDRYRYQFLIKGSNIYSMNRAIEMVRSSQIFSSTIQISIDIDPQSTFF